MDIPVYVLCVCVCDVCMCYVCVLSLCVLCVCVCYVCVFSVMCVCVCDLSVCYVCCVCAPTVTHSHPCFTNPPLTACRAPTAPQALTKPHGLAQGALTLS